MEIFIEKVSYNPPCMQLLFLKLSCQILEFFLILFDISKPLNCAVMLSVNTTAAFLNICWSLGLFLLYLQHLDNYLSLNWVFFFNDYVQFLAHLRSYFLQDCSFCFLLALRSRNIEVEVEAEALFGCINTSDVAHMNFEATFALLENQ